MSARPVHERVSGLSSAEAARRLAVDGPNAVPTARPRSLSARVIAQLRDPMILLLCAAFVLVIGLGDVSDAVIIAAVVVLNTAIGVVQELRAEKAIAALDRMAAPRARVRRDGVVVEIDAADLVVGDAVRLEAGDVVPADLRVTEAFGLEVDEAAMTGESVPVAREPGEELLSGTVVTRGRGLGVTVRTGVDSGLGRIAAMIADTGLRPTPLQRRLARLSRELVTVTAALCALVLVLGVLRGESWADSLILAVSLGVAAVPESLPAVVSVALALGAYRMARRSAVVRWLPAVETLGSVSVLASDKTGTLTEGRMVVEALWSADDPAGRLLRACVLCNDAVLTPHPDGPRVVGDPMEGALLLAAAAHDVDAAAVRRAWRRVDETPFDSVSKLMRTLHEGASGTIEVVKGAPERVIAKVEDSGAAARARVQADRFAADGFRVLGVAERVDGGDWELVGLVGIADPPRASAPDVVRELRAAGIRTILVTGDHPATARAIGERVGIVRPEGEVVDADTVARGEHVDRVEQIDVYARIQPEQKVDIVEALRARGEVVAMVGDGVNDGPALRRADIGVAMGDRGTEVARQAADLVLADDDLRTVVTAVGEGRRIYANIRAFLRYALSGGLAEVLVILTAPFLGIAAPLLPGQILWINMLTHGVPGVAFGGEPLDPAALKQPSPSPERSVLGGGLVRRVMVSGALIAVVSLVAGLLAQDRGWHVQTTVFLTLGLAQLGLALALRAPRSGRGLTERGLELAVLGAAALQALAIAVPALRDLLGTETVPWTAWVLAVALAAVPGLAALTSRTSAATGTKDPA